MTLLDAGVSKLEFQIDVSVSPSVTAVVANGEVLPLGDFATYQRTYESYEVAAAVEDIALQIFLDGELRFEGRSHPRLCSEYCIGCPGVKELIRERAQYNITNFRPEHFDVLECESSQHRHIIISGVR